MDVPEDWPYSAVKIKFLNSISHIMMCVMQAHKYPDRRDI